MDATSITNLFNDLPKRPQANGRTVAKKEPSVAIPREARTLEYQLNQHLRLKTKGNAQRVSITTPSAHTSIDDLIDKDIANRRAKKKSWNSMSACDKWACVKEYYKNNKEPYDERVTKQMLLSKKLQVVYDSDEGCIKEIKA